MRALKSVIILLAALGSAGAPAQSLVTPTPTPAPPTPSERPTYGPVLHPRPSLPATARPVPPATSTATDARPQAQEERAGQSPATGVLGEVDPSARPAPTPVQPQVRPGNQRRPGAGQRIESTPRIVVPAPPPPPRATAPRPAPPVGPQSSQVMGCIGSICTDVTGATYDSGGPGKVTVEPSGRPCTRHGVTMQCL